MFGKLPSKGMLKEDHLNCKGLARLGIVVAVVESVPPRLKLEFSYSKYSRQKNSLPV